MFDFSKYADYTTRDEVYFNTLKDYIDYLVIKYGGTIIERRDAMIKSGFIIENIGLDIDKSILNEVNPEFTTPSPVDGLLIGVVSPTETLTLYVTALDPEFFGEDAVYSIYIGLSEDTEVFGTPEVVTVSYDANGGTGDEYSSSTVKGQSLVIAENEFTAPEEKNFLEWNTEADGSGISYDPGDMYKVEKSITLYATWIDAE